MFRRNGYTEAVPHNPGKVGGVRRISSIDFEDSSLLRAGRQR